MALSSRAPTGLRGPATAPADWWRGSAPARGGGPWPATRRGPVARRHVCVDLRPGEHIEVAAWADHGRRRRRRSEIVAAAASATATSAARRRRRPRSIALLAHAADEFIVAGPRRGGRLSVVRRLVARHDDLLRGAVPALPAGAREARRAAARATRPRCRRGCWQTRPIRRPPEYNTADATLWFLHAVDRHVDATGDIDLAAELMPTRSTAIVAAHVAGTRYGIRIDPVDGLLTQGADGDGADLDGRPGRRGAGDAAVGQGGGDQRAVDQTPGRACGPARPRLGPRRRDRGRLVPTRPEPPFARFPRPTAGPTTMWSTGPDAATTRHCGPTSCSPYGLP